MTIADTQPHVPLQSTKEIATAWDRMIARRRFYTALGLVILIVAFVSSVRFADESNAGHFFDRLPHHLALLRQRATDFLPQVVRHGALLLAMWLLSRSMRGIFLPSSGQLAARPVDWINLRWIVRFAWAAALLAAIGLAIEITLWSVPLLAARVQRYYWYRLTDFAAPLALALLATAHIARGAVLRRPWATWSMAAAVALSGVFLANKALPRLGILLPPADGRLRAPLAWQDVCQWVNENTPADALFLTPRTNQSFKWHAGRAEVVTRKDIPQDARHIVEWNERIRDVFYTDAAGQTLIEPFSSPGTIGTERVLELAEKYGFDYVVATWYKPLWLPVLYPNVEFANEEYVVYRIPQPNDNRSAAGAGR